MTKTITRAARPADGSVVERFLTLSARDVGVTVDAVARTVELAFSSETPCDMWYGSEILSHAPGAMRTGVRQVTLPLLFNHERNDLLGVVESIRIDGDKVGRAVVRFGRDERGEWAMQQADDGVLVNVSFQYRVFRWIEDTEADTVTAIDWEVFEVSLVTVPADPTVGVGRGAAAPSSASAPPVPPSPAQHQEQQAMTIRQRRRALDTADNGDTGAAAGGSVAPAASAPAPAPVDAARAERERIGEIEAICRKYQLSDELRTGMVQRGATIEAARMTAADIVMERAKAGAKPAADMGQSHNPDLSANDKAKYSMLRAVHAAISGDWTKAGFELECSNDISKNLGRAPQNERGFFVPTNIPFANRAQFAAGAQATGGALVQTNLLAGSFIEVLRNKARVLQLGATVLSGLTGNIDIPRQTGQAQTFWVGEGQDVGEGEATFDKVSLTMKTIGTYSKVTRQMLMQGTPDIDMIARADMIATMALGIDLAALSGIGSSNQPLGISNTAGVGSVIGGVNGAQLSIDHLIDLETRVAEANADDASLSYLVNARTAGWLKKLKSTTGQYLWTDNPMGRRDSTPGSINGYPVARSQQVRNSLTKGTAAAICSEIFFGAWSELLIGEWGVLEIVPNPFHPEVYKSGGVMLRCLQSLDIGVRHAASFSTMSDALTP